MKVATWNLQRVRPTQPRVATIHQHIADVGADICVLTETHELVSPGDGFSSVMSSEPDRRSKPGEKWVGIWSRFALTPLTSFVSVVARARCAAARLSHPDIGSVVVYACVLPWGGSTWNGIASANGAAFAAALDVQRGDWHRLREAFPDDLLIVAGDFNQDLADRHYYGSKKKRALLENALADVGLVALTAGMNDPVARDSAPCACIDHICVSTLPAVRVGSTTRWPNAVKPVSQLSDHFGIAVELMRR
jgi:endonuclease/exonuclease/phosphatase family metal-dependent hydrolase